MWTLFASDPAWIFKVARDPETVHDPVDPAWILESGMIPCQGFVPYIADDPVGTLLSPTPAWSGKLPCTRSCGDLNICSNRIPRGFRRSCVDHYIYAHAMLKIYE